MAEEARNLRDVLPPGMLKPPLKKEDVLDATITVHSVSLLPGEFGDFMRIKATVGGELRTILTGAALIQERLLAAQDSFPVTCTVRKVGRSWLVE